MSQAARQAEKVIGHGDNATSAQNVTNPGNDESTADYSETMKALAWYGKNEVRMIDTPKPKILEDRDVIVKVTGSTVCGSDLHLLHGTVVEMQKGDILGHEFCGVVDECGPGVTKFKKGQRVVASFQIACGDCYYCKQKLSSQCEKTNSNTIENAMYGGRTAGMFGYSHFTGGYAVVKQSTLAWHTATSTYYRFPMMFLTRRVSSFLTFCAPHGTPLSTLVSTRVM